MVKISEFLIEDMPYLQWDGHLLLKEANKYKISKDQLKQYKKEFFNYSANKYIKAEEIENAQISKLVNKSRQ